MSNKVTGWVFVPDAQPAAPAAADPEQEKWTRIEADYRAGIKVLRAMADEHGISEGAIRKRAKKYGWSRDLSAKIAARTDELVRKEAVRSDGTQSTQLPPETEKAVVEANATMQANVILRHRKAIGRYQAMLDRLADELEAAARVVPELEQLGKMMFAPDRNGKDRLNELYHAVIAYPGRIECMKKLAETLKILVGLERQAFKLEDYTGDGKEDRLSRVVQQIWGSNRGLPIKE